MPVYSNVATRLAGAIRYACDDKSSPAEATQRVRPRFSVSLRVGRRCAVATVNPASSTVDGLTGLTSAKRHRVGRLLIGDARRGAGRRPPYRRRDGHERHR